MEGPRSSFPIIRLTFQVRKVMGDIEQSAMLVCAVGYVGGLQDYSDSPSPIPTLDLNFLDLDWTGLDLGLGLRNQELDLGLSIGFDYKKSEKLWLAPKAILRYIS